MAKPSFPSEISDLIKRSDSAFDECLASLGSLQAAFVRDRNLTAALPDFGQDILENLTVALTQAASARGALAKAYEQLLSATERGRPVLKLVNNSETSSDTP